jgi:hypothetical protein
MIISVHIRKCAGTSFRKALSEYFSNKLLLDYGDEIGSSWPSSESKRLTSSNILQKNCDNVSKQYDIIHGHFHRAKYDCITVKKHYVTFMRHPVYRLLSNYHYLKRNHDRRNPDALIVNKLGFSLEEFAQHPDNRNLQSQYLQSENLSEFDFVGITEEYENSIKKMNDMLNLTLSYQSSENVNPFSIEQYGISSKTFSLIENCNSLDMELYEIAKERLLSY